MKGFIRPSRPDWIGKVKTGDKLMPDPLWNKTERERKMTTPMTVRSVKRMNSDYGVCFKVEFTNNTTAWLSAGWFLGSEEAEE